uniref:Uncharacterized protein n=1 Tax=Macaca fascicularis TaxID=9541 RepID=A0A7N9CFL3_MACFA
CWLCDFKMLKPKRFIQCLFLGSIQKQSCRVHVHNVQVCYICILVPCCCAAPINSSFTYNSLFVSF